MYKNNNKAVIKKLAKRSLEFGKLRNFFVVLTIVLAVSLVLVLALYATGVKESEKVALSKAPQVTYKGVKEDQPLYLENDPRIEEILFTKSDMTFEIEDYLIKLAYIPNTGDKIETIWEKLVEGDFPKEQNEIAVDRAYLEEIGIEPQIGSQVSITFLDGITENFIVSGILETKPSGKNYMVYTSEAYAEKGSQLKNVSYDGMVRINGASKMSESEFMGTIQTIGFENNIPQKDIRKNNAFVRTIAIDSSTMVAVVLVGALVVLASVLVIYSVFYISVLGKTREFGQLRTIGMTRKQVKKMIGREGLILGSIGIFFGTILSWGIVYLMIPMGWHWKNTLIATAAVMMVNFITVMLSIMKPGKLASEISPIEASKISADGGGMKQKEKNNKKITSFNLAFTHFKRNRKRTLATAISLGISGVLFMVGTTYLVSQNKEEFSRQGDLNFGEYMIDFSINVIQTSEHGESDIQMENPFTAVFIDEIRRVPNVEKVEPVNGTPIKFEYNKTLDGGTVTPFTREEVDILNQYLEEGTIDYDKMVANNEILILGNNVTKENYGWKYKLGDQGILHTFNGKEIQETFTIAGFLETKYLAEKPTGWFLVPQETMSRMMGDMNLTSEVIISGDYKTHGTQIEEDLRKIIEKNPVLNLSTLEEKLERDQGTFATMYLMVLGLTLFIILFSLINLVNTLVTGLITRKQEFALLESVGMSSAQFFRMIQYEGVILSGINLLVTLILGTALGAGLVFMMRESGVTYMHYQFPIWFMLGYTGVVLLIPMVIGQLFIKRNKKQTLVERLRDVK